MAFLDQAMQVIVGALHRDAAHRDVLPQVLAAFGQHDAERLRGDLGVIEEQLVEIPHAIEQEQAGMGGLDLEILFHHRRQPPDGFGGLFGVELGGVGGLDCHGGAN